MPGISVPSAVLSSDMAVWLVAILPTDDIIISYIVNYCQHYMPLSSTVSSMTHDRSRADDAAESACRLGSLRARWNPAPRLLTS